MSLLSFYFVIRLSDGCTRKVVSILMLALGHIFRIRAISYSRIHTLLLACRNHCRAWYIEKENAVCVRGTPSSGGNIRDNITHVHALLGVLGCPLGDGDVKTGLSRITDMREMWRRKDLWGRHSLFEIVLSCQLYVCTVSVTFQKESYALKKIIKKLFVSLNFFNWISLWGKCCLSVAPFILNIF